MEKLIALLVLSPDEALKDRAHCPRPQCRITNSLFQRLVIGLVGCCASETLLLAQSQTLQPELEGRELRDMNEAAFFFSFGAMFRELDVQCLYL